MTRPHAGVAGHDKALCRGDRLRPRSPIRVAPRPGRPLAGVTTNRGSARARWRRSPGGATAPRNSARLRARAAIACTRAMTVQ
ncbi:hypothetical protein GW17_00008368 [Ensete ventricosum]|nr:hypothetical protein GW17_00008368 [Ensete ventricosum]